MTIARAKKMTKQRGKSINQGTILVDHVEQFALLKRANMAETARLREFFYALIFQTDKEQKRRIAIALARSVYTPRSILIFLSLEAIDIASPVLLFSLALKDTDLQNILQKTSLDHARVIARRDNISRETVNLLIDKDDAEQTVWKILKQNATLRDTLPKEAPAPKTNPSKAVSTSGLPLKTSPTSEAALPVAPATPSRDLGQGLVELANKGNRLRREKRPLVEPPQPEFIRQFGEALIIAARKGDHACISRTIRESCGLKEETTLTYIRRQDIGTFACLLSVFNIPNFIAGRILLLLFPALGQSKAVFSKVMAHYEGLERPKVVAFFMSQGAYFDVRRTQAQTDVQTGNFEKLVESRRKSLQKPADDPGKRRPEYPRFAMA
ncbi:MAG: hypothetical protein AAGA53_01470 [Pseudomonadota bacterium]